MTQPFMSRKIESLKKDNLYRKLKCLNNIRGVDVVIGEEKLINFSSNDYFNFSQRPEIAEAAFKSACTYGTGSRASRLISGTLFLHNEFEEQLAEFLGVEKTLVYPSGYMANVGLFSSLGKDYCFIADRLCHASIYDGIMLGKGTLKRYQHLSVESAEKALEETGDTDAVLITDSVFSMTGDTAPLDMLYAAVKEKNGLFIVDEAHAFGVRGNNGAGISEEAGLKGKVDIIVATMSKALGCQGGIVGGSGEMIEYLVNKSRSFIYTTGISPLLLGAAMKALEILRQEGTGLREKLTRNIERIKQGLIECGIAGNDSEFTHIIPLRIGSNENALKAAEFFMKNGILAVAIRPPTVPEGSSMIRISVTAGHSDRHINRLMHVIKEGAREFSISTF